MASSYVPISCMGKQRYASAHEAAKAKKSLSSRRNAKQREVVQYRCDHCSGWHLANPKNTVNLKERRKLRDRFDRRHHSDWA